jgi:hypothetical protein
VVLSDDGLRVNREIEKHAFAQWCADYLYDVLKGGEGVKLHTHNISNLEGSVVFVNVAGKDPGGMTPRCVSDFKLHGMYCAPLEHVASKFDDLWVLKPLRENPEFKVWSEDLVQLVTTCDVTSELVWLFVSNCGHMQMCKTGIVL